MAGAEDEARLDALAERLPPDLARRLGDRWIRPQHLREGPQRVWVDHEALAEVDPDADLHAWHQRLVDTGLRGLDADDPALPGPLRDLLHCHEPIDLIGGPFGVLALMVLLPMVAVALMVAGWQWLGLALLSVPLAVVLREPLLGVFTWLWPRIAGEPFPWGGEARKRRALQALRDQPFVVQVGDTLVENLPPVARLDGWLLELCDARDAAEERRSRAEDLRERLEGLGERLGDDQVEPHLQALDDVIEEERRLLERIDALRLRVAEQSADLHEHLGDARDLGELAELAEATRELAGTPAADVPERVAAEIEVDLSDLEAEMRAVRGEIADEEARARAMAEVEALHAS